MSKKRRRHRSGAFGAPTASYSGASGFYGDSYSRGLGMRPRVFLARYGVLSFRDRDLEGRFALQHFADEPVRCFLIRTGLGDRIIRRAGAAVGFGPVLDLARVMSRTIFLDKRLKHCVDRTVRRQVLFAKGRTGAGAHSPKVFKLESHYRC